MAPPPLKGHRMPVSAAPQDERGSSRDRLVDEVRAALALLQDPRGVHPSQTQALSSHGDELEMCAAVYAMPEDFRELGRTGIPLLWPWPATAFRPAQSRRQQLLVAAAMLISAVERLDRRTHRGRANLHIVDDVPAAAMTATNHQVGQNTVCPDHRASSVRTVSGLGAGGPSL
jgi:hypothetical protein